jgi:pyruvate/2-oxoglutarate dehydrogenase complex dihydrolipoamide dehydrogenase (E3) component
VSQREDSPGPHIEPADEANRALLANVHPSGWVSPEPAPSYDLVVIGAGTAGLVSAAGAAGLGARVALVERDLMGGDCLNVGCVPSKALVRAARAFADARDAGAFGVVLPSPPQVDFPAVMERMRRLRAHLSRTDSAERFAGLGVDVFLGQGRFVAADAVEVGGKRLRFGRAVIATGARSAPPPVPGLPDAGYLTNETVFSLTDLPPRLAILGAGPIGCELAQTFARFGARVSLIEAGPQVLPHEDADAAERIVAALRRDAVIVLLGTKAVAARRRGAETILEVEHGGTRSEVIADAVLVAVGRLPNVDGLDLERAGVACDASRGVRVDDHLRTTNPRIFAAGDVCTPWKFTHHSDAQARIVLRNALFLGRARASALTLPWCTYTDPEVAHVGLSEADARERGVRVRSFVQDLGDVDRAVLDGETDGFVKILVREGSDEIVGATIVARHAGESISELTLAIVAGIGLGRLADVIHPYPTQAEAIRKLGDTYNRTRLTPFVKRLLAAWLAWRR